ncbi:oxysterol-binding protein related protein OSH3 KNAG_0B04570 [Huiozyma naganishii CBS 8797]|uniref:PH domain-containing protein n=1 Tax=Huiozyma naganishii (strain ATCC MYA-139 / BCRC 22969 / CBS 8797 / KCTC 17520 / NBRC 10181 / NCYC 3082 / Yp74L-3) TaxID=1071383 RepID=J7S4Z2_HUIN7|nr:hypothetical protein KNAG_0B04570 [Kazachstania naganishii CBS 8797]CCK68891.1 hypothetical protein KNAG_0B04570 [Kazachstania naganishii CBS 8797]
METIDIQNRSFVVRWVKCNHGDTINYQVKPLKKSIELGIYKKLKLSVDNGNGDDHQPNSRHNSSVHIAEDTRSVLDFASKTLKNRTSSFSTTDDSHSSLSLSNIQQQSMEGSLRDRLEASGFTLVKWIGHIYANKMTEGVLDVEDNDYYYAFILDNTSSKNVRKKTLFNASVVRDDVQSTISTKSAPSPRTSSFQLSTYQKDAPLFVGQGRYLEGYLSKKRRKRLQGFKRRFFTLDFRYGTLSYYMNNHIQARRGEIVINLSTVSANKRDKLIIIDSGMEIWALKAKDTNSWQTWVDALQKCFDKNNEPEVGDDEDAGLAATLKDEREVLTLKKDQDIPLSEKERISSSIDDDSYVPLPNEAYEDFFANLTIIQQRLEECKNESKLYSQTQNDNRLYKLGRSPSSSSSINAGVERVKMMSPVSPNESTNSLSSHMTSSNIDGLADSRDHNLYQKLSELEIVVQQFVKQSKILTADFTQVTRKVKEQICPSIKSSLTGNEEFFDAQDAASRRVIMLDDEEVSDEADVESTKDTSVVLEDEDTRDLKKTIMRENNARATREMTPLSEVSSSQTKEDQAEDNDLYPLPIKKQFYAVMILHRLLLPLPSLLSFLRKNVGKDLSSIAMPVTSNEPLTILQMISETFEYASLLNNLDTQAEPLVTVSAFAISFLSIYREKTRALRKPFNPLLGETFELVKEDMGFRLVAEKVCHKPQIFAFFAQHENWECSYTVSPVQKFWGKSLEFNNEGTIELKCKKTGEYFEWSQPITILKNLIAGERYVEPSNEFEIVSSKSGKTTVEFEKTGMFGGRSESVAVVLTQDNNSNNRRQIISGKWTEKLIDTKTKGTIWSVGDLVSNSKKKYGYTKFSANLNEVTELEKGQLPPTDSRLRPDVKAYEAGDIETAETLKLQLEQKQRERRQRGEDVEPQYFVKSSSKTWQYKRGPDSYWERRKRQDWSNVVPLW